MFRQCGYPDFKYVLKVVPPLTLPVLGGQRHQEIRSCVKIRAAALSDMTGNAPPEDVQNEIRL